MDIYYMSDSIQYGSLRNPLYRDYEKFPYGTLENPLNSPSKSTSNSQQIKRSNEGSYLAAQGKSKGGKSSKDSCPFCKEQKKRPLGAYMRKRGQRIHNESISEDTEECDEIREEDEENPEECPGSGSEYGGSPSDGGMIPHHDGHHHHHNKLGKTAGPGQYSRQESQESDGK
ncbi:uncharacterized protein LOC129744445 [Uranotaenia lowii]|uniref:uncharacterized protein LOC129744445 n=1 Tax=Uranotaenia lowii TaxID=190385 RepID=UPI00247A92C5|nr:uncharacterized protein LOC129744445 [Uranotaenia lowii]XP_055592938.1 uncharacterized protein LOC129744445 [Uranotaenia lowii]XP_055592939.1 uncharacterized protein LOC129744445 [Uranotaenia lowii]XP_055592940.1 uncharacterized protein LOC129744445 [Uranotaenia lowii]XP_055592941.1 uncharacterized protein LOC129744445 [Uranotaenia lowii]XP_055592942.1 uncharacterized protein LOC129744445 [Uranotaenia lowii]